MTNWTFAYLIIPQSFIITIAAYALFSITEYILVPINSLFHFFIYWDCSNILIKLTGDHYSFCAIITW